MKAIKLVLVSLLLIAFSFNSFSQGNFTFNVMGALPVSDYGSDDLESDDSGGAGLGFGLGLQYVQPIMDNGLGLFVAVDAIYNGLKKSVKDEYEDMIGSEGDFKWPKLLNFPISAGLNFTTGADSEIGMFVNAGLTYNFFKMTKMEIEAGGETGSIEADLASALGFRIGGGIILNNKTSIFINYMSLGNHDITQKMSVVGESEEWDVKQKIDLITFGVGFRF
jgi:hypothetical protein